jgi:hypothetical protein
LSANLPEPVAAYLAAANRHDVEAVLSTFGEDACVADEGRERHGPTELRAWIEDTTTKYAPTTEVLAIAGTTRQPVVTARVSGTFPGSPLDLTYAFVLEDDRIVRLAISA